MAPARKGRQQRGKTPRLRPEPGATRSLVRGRATASSPAISEETLSPPPTPRRPRGPRGPPPPPRPPPSDRIFNVTESTEIYTSGYWSAWSDV